MTFKEYLNENNTPSTAKRYFRDVEIYTDAVGEKSALNSSYQDIMDYVSELRKQYKPQMIKVVLAGLKKYYQYLVQEGKRNDNPCKNIFLKDKRKEIQLQDLFSTKELEFLMEREERYGILEIRNKVVLSLLIYQALPVGSMVSLQLKDIDLEKGEIYIKSNNTTNARTLSLKTNQILLFHKYIEEIRPQLLKRKSQSFIITKLGSPEKGDGINYVVSTFQSFYPDRKLNPKTIRQSVIHNLLKEGKDLRLVQYFAGHKYPSSTERYKSSDVDVLKEWVEKYHPY